jgi:hypothetical protein
MYVLGQASSLRTLPRTALVAAAAAAGRKRPVIRAPLHFRAVGKGGLNCPSEFYRSINPISVGKQMFLVFPLDFRSSYGPDSSPFFNPWKFVTSLSIALIGCSCNFQPMRRRFITDHMIFNRAYTYKFQLKVSIMNLSPLFTVVCQLAYVHWRRF